MVIAFEGNVHSGKTYFTKQFLHKHKDFIFIPEIHFIEKPNQFEQQEYYIKEEISKKSNNLDKNILLDRSIISTIIFTQYSTMLTKQDKKFLLYKIEKAISNKDLFFPDIVYIFLYPFNKIVDNHDILYKTKNTQDVLVTYDYYCFTLKILSNLGYMYRIVYNDDDRQILEVKNVKLNQTQNNIIAINLTKINSAYNLNKFYAKYIIKREKVDENFLKALLYFAKSLNNNNFSALIHDIYKNIPLIYHFKTKDVINIIKNLLNCELQIDLNKKNNVVFLIDIMEFIKNYREQIKC